MTTQTLTNETICIIRRWHTARSGCLAALVPANCCPLFVCLRRTTFAPAQIADRYEGRNIIIRRLRRQQVMGALLLVVTAALMFMSAYHWPPFRGGEWKIALLIAVFLELYTTLRIDAEVKKEK